MLRWIQKDKLLESISNDFEKRRRLYFAKRTLSPIFWSQRKCVCNAKAQQEHRFEWCQVHIARRWQCAISTYQSSPETKCFVALGSYAYFGNRYTHCFDYSEHIPVCFCSSSPTQPQWTTLQMLVMNVASLKILASHLTIAKANDVHSEWLICGKKYETLVAFLGLTHNGHLLLP